MSKRCNRCGWVFSDSVKVCENCGQVLEVATYEMDKSYNETSTKSSVLAVFGSIGLAVSMFLPYFVYEAFGYSESVALIDYGDSSDAYIMIAVAIVAFILGLIGKKEEKYIGIVAIILSGYVFIAMKDEIEDSLGILSSLISFGIGAYLSIISSVCILIGAVKDLSGNE